MLKQKKFLKELKVPSDYQNYNTLKPITTKTMKTALTGAYNPLKTCRSRYTG